MIAQQTEHQRGRAFRKLLFMFELAVCLSGLVFAPFADALQLQIQQDLVMRQPDLAPRGLLKRGSVIDVPTQYRVPRSGLVDVNASLENWLRKVGYQQTNNPSLTNREGNKDFFFPIHVVKAAEGSYMTEVKDGVTANVAFSNQEYFVPLRHLSKYGDLLVVDADSPVYSWRGKAPLQTLESRQLMERADVARANCNCDVRGQAIGGQTQSELAAAARAVTQAGRQQAAPRTEMAPTRGGFSTPIPNGVPIQGLERACANFIDRDGNYGAYGEMVLDEIRRYPIYNSPSNGLTRVCRNFNSFDEPQKKQFWVWVYASLASQESGCNPAARSNPKKVYNPNGIAVGLFQMELDEDLRADRDRLYRGNYCSGNPFDPQVNIRCSARIMAGQLANGRGLYSYSPQYWGPFKNQAFGRAKRAIARYSGCLN